jgi:hypothetical protein
MRQHRAGDAEQAEHIRAEQLLRLRAAGLLDRAEQAVAGIVDQDIDAAELFNGLPSRAVTVDGSRAVATTASPAFKAASAIKAPNPRDAPVMNQTRMMLPFPIWSGGVPKPTGKV